jgi:hypothetical protein
MFKKLSALTLTAALALTLVGSAFAQSGGRGGFIGGGYYESEGFFHGKGGDFLVGGYSEAGGLFYGGDEDFAFLGAIWKKEGLLVTGSGLFYFKVTTTIFMAGQVQITVQPTPPSPNRITEWLIAFKKPKPPYPHVVFITEIEKVYHADDECPKILLKRKLPITLKQALEWEYEPCPVCVPKNEKETK